MAINKKFYNKIMKEGKEVFNILENYDKTKELPVNIKKLQIYEEIKKQKTIKELLEFGIINLDKPSGPTSFTISDYVRKELNLNKTSHSGTIDPQVSGVLPILLGRACRLSDYFMKKDKTYVGIMRLHKDISDIELNSEMKKFIGKIIQMPPVRSRVKRAEREREVKSFEIIERDGKDVLFKSEVEAGTYIRTLIHNLGEKIGGAHMLELRRVKAGIFSEEDSNFINLYEFEKAVEEYKKGNEELLREMVIPAEYAIEKVMPVIQANMESVKQLLTGKPLMRNDININLKDNIFAVFNNGKFIGIYRKADEGDIIARPEFVLN